MFRQQVTMRIIQEEEQTYRHRYLLILEATSLAINVALALPDFLAQSPAPMVLDALSCTAMATIFLMVRFSSVESWRSLLHFGFLCCFLVSTLADVNAGLEEMEILFISAISIFQAFEVRSALHLLWGHLVLVLLCWIWAKSGFVPDWTTQISVNRFFISLSFAGVLVMITVLAALHHKKLRTRMIRVAQLYNQFSGLPGRQLLLEILESQNSGFLVFLRCQNYLDLVLVLGTGFGGNLIEALGEQLGELGEKNGADVFQLRDNEFSLLFPASRFAKHSQVEASLLEIQGGLERLHLVDGSEVSLQIVMGAVELNAKTRPNAFSLANQALQTAEILRRSIAFYTGNDQSLETAKENLKRYAQLKQCLQKESLRVVFQPVFDAKTLKPTFYEALLRIPVSGVLESIYPYLLTRQVSLL